MKHFEVSSFKKEIYEKTDYKVKRMSNLMKKKFNAQLRGRRINNILIIFKGCMAILLVVYILAMLIITKENNDRKEFDSYNKAIADRDSSFAKIAQLKVKQRRQQILEKTIKEKENVYFYAQVDALNGKIKVKKMKDDCGDSVWVWITNTKAPPCK